MKNNFLKELQKNTNYKENTKGGEYHVSTLDNNLDLFSKTFRYEDEQEIARTFSRAYFEDREMALKNLLNILDIRGGKGERKAFKVMFKELIKTNTDDALLVMKNISELGRWDYVLVAIDTQIEYEMVSLIKEGLANGDLLLGKWLPSENTSSQKTRELARKLIKLLETTPRAYRKMLSSMRAEAKIVERYLSRKENGSIDYSKVPTKAMLKYRNAFRRNDEERYNKYLDSLSKGEVKVNTKGLFPYEIIEKVEYNSDSRLIDSMWRDQRNFLPENFNKNVLVMADVSGSMSGRPMHNSIGLAIYLAERNTGVFKDVFMQFSSDTRLDKLVGDTITQKVNNIDEDAWGYSTDINKAMKTILDALKTSKSPKEDSPEYLVIISDMEFDGSVEGGTNLEKWRKDFEDMGVKLPKVIFWNVAGRTGGFPATKFDNDVAMISGFSTAVLENLFTLENLTPMKVMEETLSKYDVYLK